MGCRGREERHHHVPRRSGVVGDDAVLQVQVPVQLPDHPVGVDRLLVVGEDGHPRLQPLLLHGGDLRRRAGLAPPAVLTQPRLHLLDHCLQRDPGVARQCNVHREVLVDVLYAADAVNDGLAGRNRLSVARPGHAGANGEERVRLLEPLPGRACGGTAAAAQCQGVALVESGFARHGCIYGNLG